MLFVGFSLKLLESYFQDILVQLGLPVPFAPGREEVVLSLWFSSAKHLPCCSCKSLPPQFSWHAPGLAEGLSRSPAGSAGGVELTYHTPPGQWWGSPVLSDNTQQEHRIPTEVVPILMASGLTGKEWGGWLCWIREQLHWSGAVSYLADITKPLVAVLRPGTHFNSWCASSAPSQVWDLAIHDFT